MIVKGIASGDLECWCFLVDFETFKRVRGTDPEEFDRGRFAKEGSPYQYMLYPSDLIPAPEGEPTTVYIETGINVPSSVKPE